MPGEEQVAEAEAESSTGSTGPVISKAQVRKILASDIANMVRKVAGGQVLSAAERTALQAMGNASAGASAAGPELPEFARSMAQLAEYLSVSYKTVKRAQKDPACPPKRADGRYRIKDWRLYFQRKGTIDEGTLDEIGDKGALQAQQILLQNKILEHKYAVMRGEYVSAKDVEEDTAKLIARTKSVLLSGPASLAPQVVGVSVAEAELIITTWLRDAMAMLCSDPLGSLPTTSTPGAEEEAA